MTRADLTPAQQAVQAIHSALEAGRLGLIPTGGDHPHLVLCTVPDELSLELAARRLRVEGIGHATFHEPDIGNSLTALCTEPLESSRRKLFRRYPLFSPTTELEPCSQR